MTTQSTKGATLSEAQVDEVIALYARGTGDSVGTLAKAYGVAPLVIFNKLKKHGELAAQQESETMGPSFDNSEDADEGFGSSAAGADLAALFASPEMQQMIAQAVAERVAAMASPNISADAPATETLRVFADTVKHMLDINAMQQPGYQKPLPADEIDRRIAGKVEMFALIETLQADNDPPLWTIGPNGFFECGNAQEFLPGMQIRTYLPPAEDFIPNNDAARRMHAAMMRWLGTPTPEIGEQVKMAQMNAKLPPMVSGSLQPIRQSSPVEVVNAAQAPMPKKRALGTVVPERREMSMAERVAAGAGGDPQGPIFVGEAAAA